MAFPSAPGWNNLPNGVFSPEIYSKKVQTAFRKSTVVGSITNSDYFGEISAFGDTVKIIKEPEISVRSYARGAQIVAQDLVDSDFTLTIDQSNYAAFRVDDIETSFSHVNWENLASNRMAYRLKDNHDQEVLGYMCGYKQAAPHAVAGVARVAADIPGTKALTEAGADELLPTMKLSRPSFSNISSAGSVGDSIPVAVRLTGATSLPTTFASPLMILSRMKRLLDLQNVPTEGRFVVIDPYFEEIMRDEQGVFVNKDFAVEGGELNNGRIATGLHGFDIYRSQNLPAIGTGPGTAGTSAQSTNFGIIVAGHKAAVATAERIQKTEKFRLQDSFGDMVRTMHLYGRKILRPEALTVARWNVA